MAPRERPPPPEAEEEEMDPDYGFFLNHLRPRGNAYVLQVNNNSNNSRSIIINDDPIHINYEEEVEDDDDESPLLSNNNNNNYYTKKKKKKKKKESEEAEDRDYVGSEVLEATTDTSSIDKNLGEFLHHLRMMRDGSVALEMDNGIVIQYEKEEEEDSVSENEGPAQSSYSSSTGIIHHALQFSSNHKSSPHQPSHYYYSSEYSPFKEKLMTTLERPFNQGEYDKLMKLANACKPVVKFRRLRADDIPYESRTMGLSYFGYYPELARKVKHADHFRGLNLLRGFFFWLKNLELEGSYMPWASKPSNCRTVPSCSYESLAKSTSHLNA